MKKVELKLNHKNVEEAYYLPKKNKYIFKFNVEGVKNEIEYDKETFEKRVGDLLGNLWMENPDSELIEIKPGKFESKGEFNPDETLIHKAILEVLKDHL